MLTRTLLPWSCTQLQTCFHLSNTFNASSKLITHHGVLAGIPLVDVGLQQVPAAESNLTAGENTDGQTVPG
jgi:hypothetical protein